jgi:hypothetical protein
MLAGAALQVSARVLIAYFVNANNSCLDYSSYRKAWQALFEHRKADPPWAIAEMTRPA